MVAGDWGMFLTDMVEIIVINGDDCGPRFAWNPRFTRICAPVILHLFSS